MQELEKIVKEMPMSYQKERLEKQLELVRHKLSRLEREMMEEVRFLRDTSTKLGIDLEQNGYQYNPRMTMQQNMLRTVIWQEVTEGQMLLKQEELEDIARRMEKNKEVVDEIDMLVR
jgi:diketogulonate reductase-like aldo/keto reductase